MLVSTNSFIKNLYDELQKRKVVIDKPILIISGQPFYVERTQQFNITFDQESNAETAPLKMANHIAEKCGDSIQFIEIVLPKHIDFKAIFWYKNICVRYLEEYMPSSDLLVARYDVMVRGI